MRSLVRVASLKSITFRGTLLAKRVLGLLAQSTNRVLRKAIPGGRCLPAIN
jgi:hypothetical protein